MCIMGKLLVLSRSSERFGDRVEAGQLLARELGYLSGKDPVILAIPRGGIIIGQELAAALHGKLDVVLAHKLRTPGHEELAMGAIGEDGSVFINRMAVRQLGIDDRDIEEEKQIQWAELMRRSQIIREIRPKVPLKGRQVVITDDGIATGSTAIAALQAVRHEQPARLIAAMPVGSEDTVRRIAEEVDEMICLRVPRDFMAVGQFYRQFDQVSDQEMLTILRKTASGEVA